MAGLAGSALSGERVRVIINNHRVHNEPNGSISIIVLIKPSMINDRARDQAERFLVYQLTN